MNDKPRKYINSAEFRAFLSVMLCYAPILHTMFFVTRGGRISTPLIALYVVLIGGVILYLFRTMWKVEKDNRNLHQPRVIDLYISVPLFLSLMLSGLFFVVWTLVLIFLIIVGSVIGSDKDSVLMPGWVMYSHFLSYLISVITGMTAIHRMKKYRVEPVTKQEAATKQEPEKDLVKNKGQNEGESNVG